MEIKMKKIFLSALFSFLIAINASSMTLRLQTPLSAGGNDCTMNNTEYSCEPKPSGFAIRAIFGFFGIGYVSSELDYGFPSTSQIKAKIRSDAVDIRGSNYDGLLTAGIGTVISGNTDIGMAWQQGGYDVTLDITGGKHAGTTSFLNLAIDVGPVEVIGGYRMWDTETSGADYVQSSQSSEDTNKWKNKYNELTVGVGIKF